MTIDQNRPTTLLIDTNTLSFFKQTPFAKKQLNMILQSELVDDVVLPPQILVEFVPYPGYPLGVPFDVHTMVDFFSASAGVHRTWL